jgi:hypothetical protein
MVKGMSPGNATITATTTNGKVSNVASITVKTTTDPVTYISGAWGLYIDGAFDTVIGEQVLYGVAADNAGNVYAVGDYYDAAEDMYKAAYWKNDVITLLPVTHGAYDVETDARDIAIAANGDVHIVGDEYYYDPEVDDYFYVARWWKNGVRQTLQGASDSGWDDDWTLGFRIKVFGDDVYIIGLDWAATARPVIWKNGTKYVPSSATTSGYRADSFGMNTTSGQLTIKGTYMGTGGGDRTWTVPGNNLANYTAYTTTGGNAGTHVYATSEGANIYLAGWSGNYSYYWTNGTRSAQLPQPTMAGGTSLSYTEAQRVFTLDGHVYVVGIGRWSTPSFMQLVQWVDGVVVTGSSAITMDLFMPGTTTYQPATSIFVK